MGKYSFLERTGRSLKNILFNFFEYFYDRNFVFEKLHASLSVSLYVSNEHGYLPILVIFLIDCFPIRGIMGFHND